MAQRVASQYTPRRSPFADPSPFAVPVQPTAADSTLARPAYTASRSSPSPNKETRAINRASVTALMDSYSNDQDPEVSVEKSASSSKSNGKGKDKESNGKTAKVEASPKAKKPADVPFDVIDRLDISGLYGGGSLTRHDGPYAAATASRNKGPRAPIGAFDPSALAPPSAAPRPPRNNSSLSPRAQATLAAMDSEGGGMRNSPYGGASPGARPGVGRRVSESSVTMGFPSSQVSGKGQQLIEMYGVRDSEAWEDFGTSRYTADEIGSHASSKESFGANGGGKAESIWDIEATLRAGRPVGKEAPPPNPVLPDDLHSFSADYKPKRSKSLAQRLRGGRRPSNVDDDQDDANKYGGKTNPSPLDSTHELSRDAPLRVSRTENARFNNQAPLPSPPSAVPSRAFGSLASPTGVRFDASEVDDAGGASRFGGGVPLKGSKSLGMESNTGAPLEGAGGLGRKMSVMQRIFGGKAK